MSKDDPNARAKCSPPVINVARTPELRGSGGAGGPAGPLIALPDPKILHNFAAAAVFFFLGRSVYPVWIYCLSGWAKIRWLWLKNQEFPHSHF